MKLIETNISDVVVFEPTVFEDDRGWFYESYSEPKFHALLSAQGITLPPSFVQENCSLSKKGVMRGLHYQLYPFAQGKLVSVVQGAVFDVAVDIREGSPTFGQWVGMELSAANRKMMWVPEGFAHGFIALEDDTVFQYRTTNVYSKEHERSIAWNDPNLAIDWPQVEGLLISDKDAVAPALDEADLPPLILKGQAEDLELPIIGDDRGSLISIEKALNIPFAIRRVYYIFGTKAGVSRGFHAHRDLQQLIVCLSGSCRMTLDDGSGRVDHLLDAPHKALLIKNMVWREMHDFSEDCVLMVIASETYDERDYIRGYDDFKRLVAHA